MEVSSFYNIPARSDERIEVGSKQLDGRVYAPHAARVQVRLDDSVRIVSTWTNELTLGDSAGRPGDTAAVRQVDVTLDRPDYRVIGSVHAAFNRESGRRRKSGRRPTQR